ncbi:putative ribonuclease H-like domain-containing protein [Tanacetum coccineum]|uniref:Ribonuclease H-like domain-containing protein n=1 Tax=Tanacetum coccineum TaxID=301880 RepID=A0ABQ5IUG6_9ASTR
MNKMYYLVVIDDYSRFTWVFFLATKDETSGILKSFITRIENIVDHKVKVIRCDNMTEFKNKKINQFYEMRGILRQFSVARTPQQNIVDERRNGTLIEAARTMLADSKLPTTFWAEVVNTACYVQNRVLVVKPHNKTPYELFHGKTPTLSFMRLFRCHVTILNTIDHLGKFDGKADEGFFVGYSLNSKSFRVFNNRTRIVEENLHIRFSESTPNVVGSTKTSDNAGQARKETKPVKYYILLPLWTADPPFSKKSKSSHDDGSKPSSDDGKKVDEDPRKESECKDQEKEDNVNSTNNVNTVSSTVNVVDDEDDGAVAKMNNLDTTIQVSPNPTTRIHKDHPLDQVIKDLQLATQTRKMLKNLEERGNKKDERGIVIRNKARLVAQRYTQEEGLDYDKVFAPVTRIKVIRLFLAYASFKEFVVYQIDVKSAFLYGNIEEEVYVYQLPRFEDPNFPDRVYKVEKALYGLHQAPRAWYETLSTYLLYNGFQRGKIDKTLFIKRHKGDILLVQVYVDDIIFGSTKKELCFAFEKLMHEKFQMSSMGELTFFLGLQVQQKKDGIFISQDKYVVEILKKFGFTEVKTASTPMETQKPLLKDEDGKEVDVHMYRSMIGSLMYLTSSRPDIMFAVCACARYQVNPKVSHLHAVKRIFRYLKGQPKLGLWYPKDSPFDLVAYTDSDYAGASLDRKSTTGGCQFLGCRLISWQCKKQTVVANSTTEAEYVAASSCCGQVLWIQNQLLDYGYNFMHTKIFIDNNSTMQRGRAKVAWDVICLPKKEGGLGLRKLDLFNKALMTSHVWDILRRKESIWIKWIHVYKIRERNFYNLPLRGNITWGWQKILQLRPIIRDFIWFRIGDGSQVSMWYDRWCNNSPLSNIISTRDIHLAVYNLTTKVKDAISDALDWEMWKLLGFSRQVWDNLKVLAGIPKVVPSIDAIVDFLSINGKRRTTKAVITKLIVAASTYVIWQERNWRLFKGQKRTSKQVFDCIHSVVRLKLLSCRFRKSKDGLAFANLWKLPASVMFE